MLEEISPRGGMFCLLQDENNSLALAPFGVVYVQNRIPTAASLESQMTTVGIDILFSILLHHYLVAY